MSVKIIVELSDDTEGEHLAALLNGGIGNEDPAKGPLSITRVKFFKSEPAIKPSFEFKAPAGKIGT